MRNLHDISVKNDYKFIFSSPQIKGNEEYEDYIPIGNRIETRLGNYMSKITGLDGFFPIFATIRFINLIEKKNVNIIHLHNLHHSYISLPILFKYIKKKNIPVIWTLHDCWSFTGHCPHFLYEKCEKWKNGCFTCPRYKEYPKSIFDNSKFMWKIKKRMFGGVDNLVLVTPSRWLANLTRQSYLKNYPVQVINNGIDLDTFKPTENNFREAYGLETKKIILGVAFDWSIKKGLDVFIELSRKLPENYKIVLVGTNDSIDRKLPNNIISIHRTKNQKELAKLYSTANVFVNPTREDTFPTVNIEAIACGTPVITFNTGGSSETVKDCGIIIDVDDFTKLEKSIYFVCETTPFAKEYLVEKSKQFDKNLCYERYLELYDSIGYRRN